MVALPTLSLPSSGSVANGPRHTPLPHRASLGPSLGAVGRCFPLPFHSLLLASSTVVSRAAHPMLGSGRVEPRSPADTHDADGGTRRTAGHGHLHPFPSSPTTSHPENQSREGPDREAQVGGETAMETEKLRLDTGDF